MLSAATGSNKCPLKFLHLLLALWLLLARQVDCANDEFPYLFKNNNNITTRVHISYELTRGETVRVQAEEYLDPENWNQLIQFKWHEDGASVSSTETILIRNGPNKKVLVKYKPHRCAMKVFTASGEPIDKESDWHQKPSFAGRVGAAKADRRQQYSDLMESIVSTDPRSSPYLSRVPNLRGIKEVWVFGALGLWMQAQYRKPLKQVSGNKNEANYWRVELEDASRAIFYQLDASLLDRDGWRKSVESSASMVDPINQIKMMNISGSDGPKTLDTIRIIGLDLKFDDDLAQRITSLPIGFNCKSNPLLAAKDGLHFIGRVSGSHLNELEIVATDLRDKISDTRTLTIVDSPHPVDPSKPLTMFKIHEDQTRVVRDFKRRLMHTIVSANSLKARRSCQIEHLQISTTPAGAQSERHYGRNPLNVQFDNGITLTIDELLLEYVFEVGQATNNNIDTLNYLNRIPIDDQLEEHVFESKVPKVHEHMISLANRNGSSLHNGLKISYSISIVRVYQSKYLVPGGEIVSPLKLARIIMMVYDKGGSGGKNKLAELRWNLVRQLQPLSLRRRASLFDLSQCSKLDEDSMQIVVKYHAEAAQLSQAQARSFEVIEDFYKSYSRKRAHLQPDSKATQTSDDRHRVASSLGNFLRVPNVDLLLLAGSDQLELRATILDEPAPIHYFDRIDGVTFLGPIIDRLAVASVEQCARYCRQMHCRMFAYERSNFQCKLSCWSIEDQHRGHQADHGNVMGPKLGEPKAVAKQLSELYYLADGVAFDTGEATLAEIHSYLEHFELTMQPKPTNESQVLEVNPSKDGAENEKGRERRSTLEEKPLLSFEMSTNYEPTVYDRKLLLPSEISLISVPLILDVSRSNQDLSVARAFSLRTTGKRYQLNALDNWNETPRQILASDERTFRQTNGSSYCTLKRVHAIEFDGCLQLCYNIEEWNFDTSSKQICRSFSYCNFEKQCVLAIDTDAAFVETVLDLVDEGDLVPLIDSSDALLRDGAGCNVNSRNNLATFEGPIGLPAGVYGPASTEGLFGGDQSISWLVGPNLESDSPDASMQERCAQVCLDRNKLHHQMCLAVDYCETPQVSESRPTKFHQHCHLCVVSSSGTTNASAIAEIKSKLADPSAATMDSVDGRGDELPPMGTCRRFLTSHLLEFNSLKQRTLSPQLMSKPTLTIDDSNIEHCAVECLLRQSNCPLFEHCSRFDVAWKSVENKCKIFDFSAIDSDELLKLGQNSTTAVSLHEGVYRRTNFSKDCHVYLRREFKSIDEALMELTKGLAEAAASKSYEHTRADPSGGLMDHSWLISCFLLMFVPVSAIFVLSIRRTLSVPPISGLASQTSNGLQATELSDLQLSQMIGRR